MTMLPAAAAVAAVMSWTIPAGAAAIVTDGTITDNVPGIAAFATTGADMSGMEVTLNFVGGGSETVAWATTGATSGAATGTGWTVSLMGDSFSANWMADFGDRFVESMMLDGRPGLTLFDLTFPDDGGTPQEGTPGSELGRDFSSSLTDDNLVTATYSRQVSVGANPPVGDIWNLLTVDFGEVNNATGATGMFTFLQDTDNDARRETRVPEPGTVALFGLGLVGLGLMRRRRRA